MNVFSVGEAQGHSVTSTFESAERTRRGAGLILWFRNQTARR